MTKAFLIFSGYNQRAVIAFIRVLERHGIEYHVVAMGFEDGIFQTKYASRVAYVREDRELTLESLTEAIDSVFARSGRSHLILAPSTEAMNRFFLKHRAFFETKGIQIPLIDTELYEKISDKKSFSEMCLAYDIVAPKEISNPFTCPLPFVAKPIAYDLKVDIAPILIYSENDRLELLKNPYFSHYYFQEFIEGRSLYLLFFLSRQGEVYKFSQENLVQQSRGKSVVAALASDFHFSDVSARYVGMLKDVAFHGLIMIEVRHHENDYYMIEANPRFWGPSQLFVDAMEHDLFDAFLVDLGFTGLQSKTSVGGDRYYWHEGLVSSLKSGEKVAFHNYLPEQLALDFSSWIESDIYRRPDTINIFVKTFLGGIQ